MEQLPFTIQSREIRQGENSFATKYLPRHLISIHQGQNSLLCTPENYMLILSYSTSLEKENQMLRAELATYKTMLQKQLIKCKQLQLCQQQIKMQSHHWQHKLPKRVSTQKCPSNIISFQKLKKINLQSSRQQPFDQENNNCGLEHLSLLKDIDDEITCILIRQNQQLNDKIQMLLKQKELAFQKHQRGAAQKYQHWKLTDKIGSLEKEPFENISLNWNLPKDESANGQRQNLNSYGKPNNKFYKSEPNSLEISFQALPSFKSAQDLPRFFCGNE